MTKYLPILLWLSLLTLPLTAREIIVQPKGDYAAIDVQRSNKAFEIFTDPNASPARKKALALEIEREPGSYNPALLLRLGGYYAETGQIEKATFWFRAALFRTTVDLRIHPEPSLQDVLPIFNAFVQDKLVKYATTKEKAAAGKKGLIAATRRLMEWDRQTPRNYDDRWVCLHSIRGFTEDKIPEVSPEQKQQIIERERSAFTEVNREYLNE